MEQIKVNVPESWNEVTIEQFQEISSLQDGEEKHIEIASIFLDEDPELIKKLDAPSQIKVFSLLSWTNQLPSDAEYKPIIEIDGEKYGFISRLSDLSIGEWIDLENYLQDSAKNMHRIFAILYRPLICSYNDKDRLLEPYEVESARARAELFKEKAMIGHIYGAMVFFSLIEKSYIKIMQDNLRVQSLKIFRENLKGTGLKGWLMKRRIEIELGNGIGIFSFTPWQRATFAKWKRFLKLNSNPL